MRGARGFTLIELLLVLAIIGIISVIAVPALLEQRERAKANALKDQAVVVVGDLTSILGELSDPPSERKAGYPTAVYSGSASDNQAKAQASIALVLARTNVATARNPYSGGAGGFQAASTPAPGSGTLGVVYLDAATASTTSDPVVTVTGVFRNPQGAVQHVTKVVSVN